MQPVAPFSVQSSSSPREHGEHYSPEPRSCDPTSSATNSGRRRHAGATNPMSIADTSSAPNSHSIDASGSHDSGLRRNCLTSTTPTTSQAPTTSQRPRLMPSRRLVSQRDHLQIAGSFFLMTTLFWINNLVNLANLAVHLTLLPHSRIFLLDLAQSHSLPARLAVRCFLLLPHQVLDLEVITLSTHQLHQYLVCLAISSSTSQ